MKSVLLRAGLLTCITTGLFYGEASAETDWSSKCSSYGEIKPNENPSFQHVNCLLTNAALEADIPPEVVKAVATQENGNWRQFNDKGETVISEDGGIGLMQITNQSNYDQEKLKNDIYYNIEAGIEILNSMYDRTKTDLPKIKGAGKQVIENWYFPVMAYNGIKPVNSPLYQLNGEKNKNAYQEKVFAYIEQHSFLNDTKLAQFPFSTTDFKYDPNSSKNIEFLKREYTVTGQTHDSAYLFKKGDKVVVTEDGVSLRPQPGTSKSGNKLANNTILIINGNFSYDQSSNENQFVWYPVKTADQKSEGYISSAYITKKIEQTEPLLTFSDILESERFYNEIYSLSEKGIIAGFPDGTFRPGATVTRAQAAIMIGRALELPIDSTKTAFSDVPFSSKAAGYIAAAYKNGIISGYPSGEFRPDQTVTRGDMAIFLARAFKLQGTADIYFSDVSKNMTAYDSIKKILAAEITVGYPDHTFKPKEGVTRGQFSAFLTRALQKDVQ
ncbi:transglycosylase SLT domain-containing protein [Bacillus aerolatus]|uniref:Transglycosylase SLT domain-containing protein n=1 Tax=Bacillus aerolatus TaxID=2653354 RepID=A0A6I1FEL9_9BACI|nr:S-layer homology domain-containing protein [Bacillus aerolatus]KAB7706297.1 transglycosylase SLT domain-containing protein [Bacillus aerolatus]